MTTPRQTFEDYNPYPPVKPVPPPPPIPPKTQKLIDVRKWTNEPMSQEYERGFLNPNVNFGIKLLLLILLKIQEMLHYLLQNGILQQNFKTYLRSTKT